MACVSSWRPIVCHAVADCLTQHADPLGALGRGEIPALVLRGWLKSEARQGILERLKTRSATWSVVGNAFANFGAALSSHLGKRWPPERYAATAARYAQLFRELDLLAPVSAVHGALAALARHRQVGVGMDLSTNGSFSPGGIFRQNFNNNSFQMHLDSLHSHELAQRSRCSERRTRLLGRSTSAAPYADLFRFEQQLSVCCLLPSSCPKFPVHHAVLSHRHRVTPCRRCLWRQALLLLQRSEVSTPELTLYDFELQQLHAACELQLHEVTTHNAVLDNRSRHKIRRSHRSCALEVEEGDVYVFNANRLHEVHRIGGATRRITLGTFAGLSDDEVRIWS